ncbi:MAG: HAMP domain-containing sensor histidine kinase [Patescibacteria group bacterium]
MDLLSCNWDTAKFLIFSQNVFDPLIYYSHLTALVLSLVFGFFVFWNNRKSIITQVLFIITLLLSYWLFGDLTLWATEKSYITMFAWSTINLAEPFIYAFSLYFIYLFIDKQDISLKKKFAIFSPLLITIILTPTVFALMGFNLTTCDRDAIEGPLVYYGYLLEIIYTLWIIVVAFSRHKKTQNKDQKHQISLAATGIVLFLLSFAFGNIIGSLFTDLSFLGEDYSWTIGQYGLFGVPIFIGLLSYMIVRFKAFNIKLFGAQALVAALVFLVGSEFFFVTSLTNRVLVGVTLVLVCIGGYLLVRSVKSEIKAKESLQVANARLQELDKQKTEFVSFATHQLRSPLTSILGNASLILEGDLGKISEPLREVVNTILLSTKTQINVVESYLNISRIELGTMKYNFVEIDFADLLREIVGEQKPTIEAKGLKYSLSIDENQTYKIKADPDKFKQVVMNIIDNSIKYTKEGSIAISLEKSLEKNVGHGAGAVVRLKIADTGVGIAPAVLPKLFQKFSRAENANEANIHGTGLGLYIAKQIMNAHGGKIWAESAGEGKGSQFYVEMPAGR